MDFMRLLKSVEELLYELVTWILFYPLTFWRSVRHPLKTMAYAEKELDDVQQEQYSDALSPPIFLLITLFVAHLFELQIASSSLASLPAFFADERNLLLFRAMTFSIFPLLFALTRLRLGGVRLTRKTLKPAFYSQCYVAGPFVLAFDLAVMLANLGSEFWPIFAAALFVLALTWYAAIQTRWLMTANGFPVWRAALMALGTIIVAYLLVLSVAAITGIVALRSQI
ncbi:hypothetical protein VW29_17530 [Devosia limi DSM 17137]|uniref:Permease n=1 Tax=Devosia limi DSM 17137 TaxID=1121477 RepID=A0A0F5LAE4_9HYPH|nr:hypothetical protein [Devosia limi]KKB79366.1 hypothetical protein VW29_17530 [Devosia limi DSM 17137]SHF30720.1 hypothetical protein SAMN02745223_02295 [Devosia limi DSM 17137]